MNDVIWVLAVICFWVLLFSSLVFAVRFVSHEHDDEETTCAVDDAAYANDKLAAT